MQAQIQSLINKLIKVNLKNENKFFIGYPERVFEDFFTMKEKLGDKAHQIIYFDEIGNIVDNLVNDSSALKTITIGFKDVDHTIQFVGTDVKLDYSSTGIKLVATNLFENEEEYAKRYLDDLLKGETVRVSYHLANFIFGTKKDFNNLDLFPIKVDKRQVFSYFRKRVLDLKLVKHEGTHFVVDDDLIRILPYECVGKEFEMRDEVYEKLLRPHLMVKLDEPFTECSIGFVDDLFIFLRCYFVTNKTTLQEAINQYHLICKFKLTKETLKNIVESVMNFNDSCLYEPFEGMDSVNNSFLRYTLKPLGVDKKVVDYIIQNVRAKPLVDKLLLIEAVKNFCESVRNIKKIEDYINFEALQNLSVSISLVNFDQEFKKFVENYTFIRNALHAKLHTIQKDETFRNVITLFIGYLIDYYKTTNSTETGKALKIYNKLKHLKINYTTDTVYNYYKNGKIREEINYENGIKHGVYKYYFENGNLGMELNYRYGISNGSQKHWHENNTLKAEWTTVDGEKDGVYKSYHFNGQLHIQTFYVLGKLNGMYKQWYVSNELNTLGQIQLQIEYVNGKPVGTQYNWSRSGTLQKEIKHTEIDYKLITQKTLLLNLNMVRDEITEYITLEKRDDEKFKEIVNNLLHLQVVEKLYEEYKNKYEF